MTAFDAFIKSGPILLWTFQKKEENDLKSFKGFKRLSLCIAIRGFRSISFFFFAFHFVTVVVMTGF